jgi:hypothetical protein
MQWDDPEESWLAGISQVDALLMDAELNDAILLSLGGLYTRRSMLTTAMGMCVALMMAAMAMMLMVQTGAGRERRA